MDDHSWSSVNGPWLDLEGGSNEHSNQLHLLEAGASSSAPPLQVNSQPFKIRRQ